jgi:putative transposase
MRPIVRALLEFVTSLFRSRASLQLEILVLRHQLTLYQRSSRRPRVCQSDRMLWSWLARHWARWREVLVFVQPATVLARQRTRFREHWARLSRRHAGRPEIAKEQKNQGALSPPPDFLVELRGFEPLAS